MYWTEYMYSIDNLHLLVCHLPLLLLFYFQFFEPVQLLEGTYVNVLAYIANTNARLMGISYSNFHRTFDDFVLTNKMERNRLEFNLACRVNLQMHSTK